MCANPIDNAHDGVYNEFTRHIVMCADGSAHTDVCFYFITRTNVCQWGFDNYAKKNDTSQRPQQFLRLR